MRVQNFPAGVFIVMSQILALTSIDSAGGPPPHSSGKKLIEFGWDEPDTAFMREHVAQMEETPFDGCVFHVNSIDRNGQSGNLTWQGWGERAFSETELSQPVDDLKATPFRRFTHNFLRFNTT